MIERIRTGRAGAALAIVGMSAALVATGCGGGDEEDTQAQVNKICKDLENDTKALNSVESEEDFAAEGKKVTPKLDKALEDLQNVKANDDVRKKSGDDYTAFVQNFADTTGVFKQMIAAAEQGDSETFQAGGTELERLDKESDALAKKLGFDDCVSKS